MEFWYQETLTHFSASCVIGRFSIPPKVVMQLWGVPLDQISRGPHTQGVPGVSLILKLLKTSQPHFLSDKWHHALQNGTMHYKTSRKKRPSFIYGCCNWIQVGISLFIVRMQPILQRNSIFWMYIGCPDDPKTYLYKSPRRITWYVVRYDVTLIGDWRTVQLKLDKSQNETLGRPSKHQCKYQLRMQSWPI
jgi:hypothetical protein